MYSPIVAQITIGRQDPPNKDALLDLKESSDDSSAKGLLLPRVSLISENDPFPLSEHVEGMYVYNKTSNTDVAPGNYLNDGVKWNKVKMPQNEPWFETTNHIPAITVDENIYHTGVVGVNASVVHPSALMAVDSNSKGMLIPRLSKEERDRIPNPATGLLVYNISSSCLNFYNGALKKWISLCGKQDPAVLDLLNCDVPPTGPQGVFTVANPLDATNAYTINVNVTSVGPYDIRGNTSNGYSFSKSGVFNALGPYQIRLDGRGTPGQEGKDILTLFFNANKITPGCELPKIQVEGGQAEFTVANCDNILVHGNYVKNEPLSKIEHYIIVELNITKAGPLQLETLTYNGIRFYSDPLNLSVENGKRIIMYGEGTPLVNGTYTGNKINVEGVNCAPLIRVGKGTFDYPANSCQEIMDEDPNAKDGYYWVGAVAGKPYLTYCDMDVNGAWTLVKSLSENTIFQEQLQAEALSSQIERGVVTSRNGVFNEYRFALPSETVNNIGLYNNNFNPNAPKRFRFTVKQNGHKIRYGMSQEDVAMTTTSPDKDLWTQENYWNVTIIKGNPAVDKYYYGGTSDMSEGKVFGKSFGKATYTSNADYQYNGVKYTIAPVGMSQVSYYVGFYGHVGHGAGRGAVTYHYKDENGFPINKSFTFDRGDINELFGYYMGTEKQLNHHIGTCSNSQDDYGGEGSCKAGWKNWRPHKFNFNESTGKYEGRIVQYWVK